MEIRKFALWPKKVTSGKLVWFSWYIEHRELFDRNTGRAPITTFEFKWTETESEKTWRVLKEYAVQNRNVWNDPELTKQDKQ
jgi:hypothetical protein